MWQIITIVGVSAAFLGTAQITSVAVPATLIEAAQQQSPLDFAAALAGAAVPSGFEIKAADDGPPSSAAAVTADSQQKVALTDLIAVFEGRHSGYRARMIGGVLVVRPVEGTLPFLDEASSIYPPVKVTGIMDAARRVFLPLDPRLSGPVLNGIGRPGDNVPVALDGSGGRTVIDTLNQIVSQLPGRAWVVTTSQQGRDIRVIGFGFIDGKGSRRTQPLLH
jgi:hypothetical protein